MKTLSAILLSVLASSAVASEPPAMRLAEATPPDWRGEKGLVFAADRATLAFEGGGAAPTAEVRRAPGAPFAPVQLAPDPAMPSRWLLDLPETGWYDIRLSHATSTDLTARSADLQPRSGDLSAQSADLTLTAAVVGKPIPEAWRTNSVFGLWNVHGDPALIRLAGARWNRRMTAFHSVTQREAEEWGNPHAESAEGAERGGGSGGEPPVVCSPYDERDGLRQVGVFSFGLPPWTMSIPEGVKMPSFGSLFYPATNWDDVARCVTAYARTHALPRDFSIYNEPLAHFKGKPAQIADYARAVRAGLKAADPSFRVGGPGLYSIRLRDLTAIEEGRLLDSLDFLDLHAYVGGTPPEGEFVRKIRMLREWLAERGRGDLPVYLTEFGWTAAAGTWQPPVDRATQARYVARSLALAWSERMQALVYFALDFRTKKAGEAAFSLIGPDGRPEAGYAAFAAVSRHFASSEPIGRFQLAPGVHLVAGRRDGRLQLMAWAEEGTPPRALRLPYPIASVRDGLGAPVRGTLPPLGPSPLFLETEPLPAAQLRLPTLPVRTVARLPKPSNGAFWAVEPDNDPPDGTYAMFLPRVGGGWGVQPYELRSPATIEETQLAWPADSVKPVLEVVVRSHETNGALAATLSLGNGVSTDLSLAPGATETVRWPLSGMDHWSGRRNRAAIRLSLPDGSVRERAAEWTVLPVLDAADADHPPVLVAPWADFTDWEPFGVQAEPLVTRRSSLVTDGEAAVPDCNGRVRLLHDAEALTVEVEVRDDEHAPAADPSRLWSADSIQLGFDLDWAKPWEAGFAGAGSSQTLGGHRVFEWSVGGDGRGPAVAWRERSWDDALPVGACAAVEACVERDEAAARTRYRVRFPWAQLGAAARPPRPGEAIGFSLAVNDVDPARGAPRHGLTLFGGIVDDKDPKRFGPAWLRPPPSPAPRFGFDSWSLRAVHGAKVEREGKDAVRLRMPSAEWSCGLKLEPPAGSPSVDLSRGKWLAVDIENLSPDRQMRLTMHVSSGGANSEAADHAVANFTKNRAVNTGIALNPGEKATMRLLLPHPAVYAAPEGVPGPRLVDTARVNAIELQCQWPFEDEFRWVVDCRLSNLRLEGEPAAPFPQGAAFFPFVDRYGQFRHADWPEKVHSDDELRADLARERADLAASPRPAAWDRFGGWKDGPRLRATGAFRTELVDGKWWLVTPEGHLFFSTGIDVVRDNTDSSDGSKHPDWHETPVPPSKSMAYPAWNLRKKFGKDDYLADYYDFVQKRLPAWGINTVGNWSGRELLCAASMPYVLSLGENERSIPHVPGGLKFYDCFATNFVPALRAHLAKRFREDPAAARARKDPLCIGFFFDNEPQVGPIIAKALAAPYADCAAKRALLKRAHEKYGADIAALNAAWGTSFAGWEAAKAISAEPKGPGWRAFRDAFRREWLERYFRAVKEAIAAEAPGRLYLGCRLVGFRQDAAVWDAAARHCDVVSVNAYANSIANLPKDAAGCGKPILLGEFHFGCLDRGMFRASLCPVADQAERARSYARLVEGALSHPALVGCHWFQYRDQPLVGRGDGEAYQCGFVDVADRPYAELCAAAREIGETMYPRRAAAKP